MEMNSNSKSPKIWKYPQYGVEVYVSYAHSVALGVERRCRENPPTRPAEYWRIFEQEINEARWRMRRVSGAFAAAKKVHED